MIFAGLCAATLALHPLSPQDAKAFRGDVDFVVSTVEKLHPAPFAHADATAFRKDADAVKSEASEEGAGLFRGATD